MGSVKGAMDERDEQRGKAAMGIGGKSQSDGWEDGARARRLLRGSEDMLNFLDRDSERMQERSHQMHSPLQSDKQLDHARLHADAHMTQKERTLLENAASVKHVARSSAFAGPIGAGHAEGNQSSLGAYPDREDRRERTEVGFSELRGSRGENLGAVEGTAWQGDECMSSHNALYSRERQYGIAAQGDAREMDESSKLRLEAQKQLWVVIVPSVLPGPCERLACTARLYDTCQRIVKSDARTRACTPAEAFSTVYCKRMHLEHTRALTNVRRRARIDLDAWQ